MFYADILTREKIKVGKLLIDKLLEEGWEVYGAAWLLHGYEPEPDEWYPGCDSEKQWRLHFFMQRGTPKSEDWAFGRVLDLSKGYVDALHDDALFDDYFEISVDSPDEHLAKILLSSRPNEHPLGKRIHRVDCGYASGIFGGFLYNLGHPSAHKKSGQDSRAD